MRHFWFVRCNSSGCVLKGRLTKLTRASETTLWVREWGLETCSPSAIPPRQRAFSPGAPASRWSPRTECHSWTAIVRPASGSNSGYQPGTADQSFARITLRKKGEEALPSEGGPVEKGRGMLLITCPPLLFCLSSCFLLRVWPALQATVHLREGNTLWQESDIRGEATGAPLQRRWLWERRRQGGCWDTWEGEKRGQRTRWGGGIKQWEKEDVLGRLGLLYRN